METALEQIKLQIVEGKTTHWPISVEKQAGAAVKKGLRQVQQTLTDEQYC